MSTVIRLKDGKVDTIFCDRHFVDLVREYMGDDSVDFYENRIAEMKEQGEILMEEVEYFLEHDLRKVPYNSVDELIGMHSAAANGRWCGDQRPPCGLKTAG